MMLLQKFQVYMCLGLVTIQILLAGCSSGSDGIDQVYVSPKFSVGLAMNSKQEVHGSLMVSNTGDTPFPASDEFNAEMNLWTSNGELRTRIEAYSIQEIAPEEDIILSDGFWQLDLGIFFLTWGAPEYGGVITVFAVEKGNNDLNIGKTVSFRVKPASYDDQIARAGSVNEFRRDEDGTITIQGETPVPDTNCVFPIIFDDKGVVEGFPIGTCALIAEGQWQISIPADLAGHGIQLEQDVSYQVILFSGDLTIPPSEPFVFYISPPVHN